MRLYLKKPAIQLVVIFAFFVLGGIIYLINIQKEYKIYGELQLIDIKLISVQKIRIDFLDAVGNNRGYHIKQLPLYIKNYDRLKSEISTDIQLYDQIQKDSIEDELHKQLREIIALRFTQLDSNLYLLSQLDLQSSIKAINAKDTIVQQKTIIAENRFEALNKHLTGKREQLLASANSLKLVNSIIFYVWIGISSVLVLYFMVRLTKKSKLLDRSNRRLRGIFNSTFSFIGFLSNDGTVLKLNRTILDFAGRKRSEVEGKKFWEWDWLELSESSLQLLKQNIMQASQGDAIFMNIKVRDLNRKQITLHANIKPLFSETGTIEGLIFEGRPIQELIDTQNALERKNEELQNFASIASHDLKEPLRMVSSFMSLLKQKYASNLDEKGLKFIQLAVDGAKRMGSLIDDILEYSSVGSEETPFEPVCMNTLMIEIQIYFSGVITEKNATISWINLPEVCGQRTGLKLLFQNLIGNALKYHQTNVPPNVSIEYEDQGVNYRFAISDNGIGIEEKHLNTIFTLFKRLHTKQEYPGTGLGLATCKKIVEFHKGKIWVESRSGEGSTFYFILPKIQIEKFDPIKDFAGFKHSNSV